MSPLKPLLIAILASVLLAAPASANPRYASFVEDANTGEVLHAHSADARRAPASLAKMMTLYVAFQALDAGELTLDEEIDVSEHAASRSGVSLGLRAGDTIPVRDAIQALIVRSANDVAAALAEHLAEDEAAFARLMTEEAQALGMGRTVFANASGLPHADQATTARDMARLARALQEHFPHYYGSFAQRRFTWRGVTYASHNHALDLIEGADGLKTGYTDASRFNVVVSASREGRRVTAVVMGGPNAGARDQHAALLIDRAFQTLEDRSRTPRRAQVMQAVARPEAAPRLQPAAYGDEPFEPEPPRLRIMLVEPTGGPIVPDAPSVDNEAEPEASEPLAPPVPHASTPSLPAERAPAPAPQPLAPHEQPQSRAWAVQVGAYSTEARALARLEDLAAARPAAVGDALRAVMPAADAGLWRARFAGMSESEADAACAALRAAGERCFVVAP